MVRSSLINIAETERNINDLRQAFAEFSLSEVHTWESIGNYSYDATRLVAPSGSLNSNIAHHAHQPSLLTQTPNYGETADATNPCIAIIMGSAFQLGHSLIFDHVSRREEKSEGLQVYPESILHCHESFVQQIRESMQAKVEVIYGLHVKNKILQDQRLSFDMLPLWGAYRGVQLVLDRETNYNNAEPEHMYRRFLLFAVHPQRFLYGQNYAESKRQDMHMEVAAKISRIPYVQQYFEERKWRSHVPINFRNVIKLRSIFDAIAQSSTSANTVSCTARTGAGHSAGKKSKILEESSSMGPPASQMMPLSVQELRSLVPLAQESMKATEGQLPSNLEELSNLPACVQQWLARHWVPVFKENSPIGITGIRAIHSRYCNYEKDDTKKATTITTMIIDLLGLHAERLCRLKKSPIDDLIYYTFDPLESMATLCNRYRKDLAMDVEPRWSVFRFGHYVLRGRRCNSNTCKGSQQGAVPRDDTPHVWAKRLELSATTARKIRGQWRGAVRSPEDCNEALAKPVESWCIHCKEKTKVHSNGDRFIDTSPRWDLGSPPKYIERRPNCLNCPLEGRTGTARFVPINSKIISIYKKRLSQFEEQWGHLPKSIKGEVLSMEPCSTSKPRLSSGQRRAHQIKVNSR